MSVDQIAGAIEVVSVATSGLALLSLVALLGV
jgi:hypothetical protein